MKNLSFIVLLSLSMMAVSCGNKNESGGNSRQVSSDPLKVGSYDGSISPQNYMITIGNETFYPSQQNQQLINQALTTAYNQGIQMNSNQQLRATISGSRVVQGQYQSGYTGYSQYNTFNVTQIVIRKW